MGEDIMPRIQRTGEERWKDKSKEALRTRPAQTLLYMMVPQQQLGDDGDEGSTETIEEKSCNLPVLQLCWNDRLVVTSRSNQKLKPAPGFASVTCCVEPHPRRMPKLA